MFSQQQHQDYLREQRLAQFAFQQLPPTPQLTYQAPVTQQLQFNPGLASPLPEQINDDEIESMADSDTTCGSASSLSFQTDAEDRDQQFQELPLLDQPEEQDDDQWLEGKLKLEDIQDPLDDLSDKVRPGFHRNARLIALGEVRQPGRYQEEEKQPCFSFKTKKSLPSNPQFSLFDSKRPWIKPSVTSSQKPTAFRRM